MFVGLPNELVIKQKNQIIMFTCLKLSLISQIHFISMHVLEKFVALHISTLIRGKYNIPKG